MNVVILAGGLGSRLREQTTLVPKPLVEIGGRPVLWHVMKGYARWGFADFILCLGYKGDAIRSYFLDYHRTSVDVAVHLGSGRVDALGSAHGEADWRVVLAETGATTGTGGRLKRVERYVDGDTFLATYGDSLSDVPIADVVAHHKRMGLAATMCVMRPAQRFGVVSFEAGRVTAFREKPDTSAEWINGGYYVFSRKVFDYLDDESALEGEPLARLVQDGQLAAYEHRGSHRAMDTQRDVDILNAEWARGSASWKTW
jgi:glucose-1-phosphate cytidylyltransferase